jgi:hypothetical protein
MATKTTNKTSRARTAGTAKKTKTAPTRSAAKKSNTPARTSNGTFATKSQMSKKTGASKPKPMPAGGSKPKGGRGGAC